MKRNLLLALGVGFGLSAFAQSQQTFKLQDRANLKYNKSVTKLFVNAPLPQNTQQDIKEKIKKIEEFLC